MDRRPLSVLLVHGGGGQGADFISTPDGRPGWVHSFLRAGYATFVLDRPGHGRSHWNDRVLGPIAPVADYEALYSRFIEPEKHGLWKEAVAHNRWPADPLSGDRFMAGQGPMAASLASSQRHVEAIAEQLFRTTGPTIIVSHSMGAPCGWALTALGGENVAAVVAAEPFGYPGMVHPLGTFDNGLVPTSYHGRHDPFDRPVAVVTGEATWMRETNALAADFLRVRAPVFEHILLEQYGITGNGHMLMSESNSGEIAELVIHWLDRNVRNDRGQVTS
ncbi:alpha/beta fold hydrolase [Sphingomonas parapaucimobilis]|uniref:alpha/beta fold hydrolase n=1 Tax=Sphingomonas parapaucimobilis TaxID=28213 RepID=UPI0039EB0061